MHADGSRFPSWVHCVTTVLTASEPCGPDCDRASDLAPGTTRAYTLGGGPEGRIWAKFAIEGLQRGKPVQVRPRGHSMRGKVGSMRGRIESGQAVTIAPVDPAVVRADDVVLVRWQGNYLLHPAKEVSDGQFLIGNHVGEINGWVPASAVRGKVVAVDD